VVVIAGIFVGSWFAIRKIKNIYREYCWDRISLIVLTGSIAVVIFWANLMKQVIPLNCLIILLLVQVVYVTLRWYVKGCRIARGY